MTRRTGLYRYYDADGALLYVGISFIPDLRQMQHARDSIWYPLQARRTVAWFESRDEAEEAERTAIKAEQPRFNQSHNRRPDPTLRQAAEEREHLRAKIGALGWPGQAPQCTGLISHLRNQIESGVFPVGAAIPKRAHLVSQFGVSAAAAQRALTELAADGYIVERRAKGYIVLPPEDRLVHVPAGRPEVAAAALKEAMSASQLQALIAALQGKAAHAA